MTTRGVGLSEEEREALFKAGEHHPDTCDCTGYAAESGYEEPEVCDGFIDTLAAVEAIVAAHTADLAAQVEAGIARVESHPVRNAMTREVTGYMLSGASWREIRSLLRGAALSAAQPDTEGGA